MVVKKNAASWRLVLGLLEAAARKARSLGGGLKSGKCTFGGFSGLRFRRDGPRAQIVTLPRWVTFAGSRMV
jgi:hypothetical protein